MNYGEIAKLASAGINFFSDGDGLFDCVISQGGVRIEGGIEIDTPEVKVKIKGFVRSPKVREVDGEIIRVTDKLGVFDNGVELKNGYKVIIDGEAYTITEARPIRQTSTTVAYRPILRRVAVHG